MPAEAYIAKLIKAGKRVAICDQTSVPQPGKIVERQVTQILTPGTISDLNQLDSKRNNYLAAIARTKDLIGFAFVDLSTGEFRITELESEGKLDDELSRVQPSELLVSDEDATSLESMINVVRTDAYCFLPDHARFALCDHFGVKSLDGFGCEEMPGRRRCGWGDCSLPQASASAADQPRHPVERLSRDEHDDRRCGDAGESGAGELPG
ncbi:MAG: hypothetical protein QM796_07630 [Chthoniobacteraceae bacterium]